jgi:hypothetical protein
MRLRTNTNTFDTTNRMCFADTVLCSFGTSIAGITSRSCPSGTQNALDRTTILLNSSGTPTRPPLSRSTVNRMESENTFCSP